MGSSHRRLADIATISSGGTPSKKKAEYWGGEIPWVSARAMDENALNDSLLYITTEGAKKGSHLAKPGDILVLTRGSGLFNRIPIIWVERQLAFNQDIKCLTALNQEDARYLYCWLIANRELLSNNLDVTGIGAGKINTDFIENMQVWWPEAKTRHRLVNICDSLLRQEDTLKRTNRHLLECARELFLHEVVAGGDSWTEGSLLDIADYRNGLAMQKFRPEGPDKGLSVLKIRELREGRCGDDSERCRSDIDDSVRVYDGDVIFSWSGSLLVDLWAGGDAGLNQHLFKVTSKCYPKWFYYLWTDYHLPSFVSMAADRATTMGHIKRSALKNATVFIPPRGELKGFDGLFGPMVDQIVTGKIEARRLEQLRDALLPGLMSGEVDVSGL